jgi:hypothetical protein
MYDKNSGFYYTGSGYYDPANGQLFGCKDKGRKEPGEDNCGEDEWHWDQSNLEEHYREHGVEFAPEVTNIDEYAQLGIDLMNASVGSDFGPLGLYGEVFGYKYKNPWGGWTQVRFTDPADSGYYATGNLHSHQIIPLFVPGGEDYYDAWDYYCGRQRQDLGYYNQDCKDMGY